MVKIFIDVTGYVCPVPMLQTKEKYAALAAGDILVIKTEHPRAVRNIMDWACRNGFPIEVDEEENGMWSIKMAKDG